MQRSYNRSFAQAIAGQLEGIGTPPRSFPAVNSITGLYWTAAFSFPVTPVANYTYSIGLASRTVSALTDGTPTQEELRNAFLEGFREYLSDLVSAKINGERLIVTARQPKVNFQQATLSGAQLSAEYLASYYEQFIPYGRFVVNTGDGSAGLPYDWRNKIIGITLATHANEKVGRNQSAQSGWKTGEVMDVVDRVNSNDGIWVETTEMIGTPVEGKSVYFLYATTDDAGKATSNTAGNGLVNHAKFKGVVTPDANGKAIALVSINRP